MYDERMRIQKAGGTVQNGRVMGILEGVSCMFAQLGHELSSVRLMQLRLVSRSIGDCRFKHVGVTAVPEIIRYGLSARDKSVLLGCDGLRSQFVFDFLASQPEVCLELHVLVLLGMALIKDADATGC